MKYVLFLMFLCSSLFAMEPSFIEDCCVSPDGSKICFEWNGDLFEVPFAGGVAKRLTATRGPESNPVYSPDGKWIAFNSYKDLVQAIYRIPTGGGNTEEIPFIGIEIVDWFPDSKCLLAIQNFNNDLDTYVKIDLESSTFQQVAGFAGSNGTLNKAGDQILFNRNGFAYREKYLGSQNGELYTYDIQQQKYNRLTRTDQNELYPVYSAEGKDVIYFVAPVGGNYQVFRATTKNAGKAKQLTSFQDKSCRKLSIAKTSDKLAFQLFDELWTYEAKTGKLAKVNIQINEDVFNSDIVYDKWNDNLDEFGISPKDDWMLFTKNSELFAVPTLGGEALQITKDQPLISSFCILKDNKQFVYVTEGPKGTSLYKSSIEHPGKCELVPWDQTHAITNINSADSVVVITYSQKYKPNRRICYNWDLTHTIFEIDSDQVISDALSPDRKWYVYLSNNDKDSKKLKVLDIKTGTRTTLEALEIWSSVNMVWNPDGTKLFMTQGDKLVRYDLQGVSDFEYDIDYWKDILKTEVAVQDSSKVKPEFVPDWDGFSLRKSEIVKKDFILITKVDSTKIWFINVLDEKMSFYQADHDGKNIKELGKNLDFSNVLSVGSRIYFKNNERLCSYNIEGQDKKDISFKASHTYNKHDLHVKAFWQLWSIYKLKIADPNTPPIDWDALYAYFRPYFDKADTYDGISAIMKEFIGDINISHSEYWLNPGSYVILRPGANLGLELDLTSNLQKGVSVKKVFNMSTLSKKYGIKDGDVLISIDGTDVSPKTDIKKLLLDKVGKKIELVFVSTEDTIHTLIKGLDYATNDEFRYEQWRAERKSMVENLSQGKIAYIHLRGMDVENYYRVRKELLSYDGITGIIVDVRNNGGGYASRWLLDLLSQEPQRLASAYDKSEGMHEDPIGFKDIPKVVLINENSFSDAEVFPKIFHSKKLGKLIGTPTSGYITAVSDMSLVDGSYARLPFISLYNIDDKEMMEGHGAQPDILVEPTIEQIIADDDVQLKRAIQELMK